MWTTLKNYPYYFVYNVDAGRKIFLFVNYTCSILFLDLFSHVFLSYVMKNISFVRESHFFWMPLVLIRQGIGCYNWASFTDVSPSLMTHSWKQFRCHKITSSAAPARKTTKCFEDRILKTDCYCRDWRGNAVSFSLKLREQGNYHIACKFYSFKNLCFNYIQCYFVFVSGVWYSV